MTGYCRKFIVKTFTVPLLSLIIRMIKSRTKEWAGYVALFFLVAETFLQDLGGEVLRKRPREDLGIDARILLKWVVTI